MASETKIQEEKEEEELSLVSTKVPKARVRFIRRVLRRSSEEEMTLSLFFLSLCSLSVEKTSLSAMVMMIVYVVYVSGDQTTDDLSLASVWEMN